jgi:hypothetical protein
MAEIFPRKSEPAFHVRGSRTNEIADPRVAAVTRSIARSIDDRERERKGVKADVVEVFSSRESRLDLPLDILARFTPFERT